MLGKIYPKVPCYIYLKISLFDNSSITSSNSYNVYSFIKLFLGQHLLQFVCLTITSSKAIFANLSSGLEHVDNGEMIELGVFKLHIFLYYSFVDCFPELIILAFPLLIGCFRRPRRQGNLTELFLHYLNYFFKIILCLRVFPQLAPNLLSL